MTLRQQYNLIKRKQAIIESLTHTQRAIAKSYISLKTKSAFNSIFGQNFISELGDENLSVEFDNNKVFISKTLEIDVDSSDLTWSCLGFDTLDRFDRFDKKLLIETVGDMFFESEDIEFIDDELRLLEKELDDKQADLKKILASLEA